jgi:hypothetical protein
MTPNVLAQAAYAYANKPEQEHGLAPDPFD